MISQSAASFWGVPSVKTVDSSETDANLSRIKARRAPRDKLQVVVGDNEGVVVGVDVGECVCVGKDDVVGDVVGEADIVGVSVGKFEATCVGVAVTEGADDGKAVDAKSVRVYCLMLIKCERSTLIFEYLLDGASVGRLIPSSSERQSKNG